MPTLTALGRLKDGTPYFAPLGELAYDPDLDRVQCHLCGGWFCALAPGHLFLTHGVDHVSYKATFGLSKGRVLQVPRLVKRKRRVMLRLLRVNLTVRESLDRAQEQVRSGALRERARAATSRPLPIDQRERAGAAAAKGTTVAQQQAETARNRRARALGFRSVESYLRRRYARDGVPLQAIELELGAGQSTILRLLGAAGIDLREEHRRWQVRERRRLAELFYRGMSDERIGRALDRSAGSVKAKRLRLGLAVRQTPPWTRAQERELAVLAQRGLSDHEIGSQLARSQRAVEERRRLLCLASEPGARWDSDQERLLLDHFGKGFRDEQIGLMMGRSPQAIRHHRQRLGLIEVSRRRWTDPEDKRLRQLVQRGLTNVEIAQIMERPRGGVGNRLRVLGIRRDT